MSDIDVKKMNSDELRELGCQIREEWDERIPEESQQPMPWLDIRLGESSMNHLRNAINDPSPPQLPPQETYGSGPLGSGHQRHRQGTVRRTARAPQADKRRGKGDAETGQSPSLLHQGTRMA